MSIAIGRANVTRTDHSNNSKWLFSARAFFPTKRKSSVSVLESSRHEFAGHLEEARLGLGRGVNQSSERWNDLLGDQSAGGVAAAESRSFGPLALCKRLGAIGMAHHGTETRNNIAASFDLNLMPIRMRHCCLNSAPQKNAAGKDPALTPGESDSRSGAPLPG